MSASPDAVRLPPVLDLNAAAPLAAELLGHRGQALAIDGSAVQRLGGQCLQVLLSAAALWRADGALFSIGPVSDRFHDDWALFGADAVHPLTAGSERFA